MGTENDRMSAYLFVHFVGTESTALSEQIYFSVSEDGTTWRTLNGGKPILISDLGEKGVRDPFILRGEDGKYYIIATDLSIYGRRNDKNPWFDCQTAGSRSLIIWESGDLAHWSEARAVAAADKNAGCAWAPEAIYDEMRGEYMVFWASKVSDDNFTVQRIYRAYTKDFKTFSEAETYIDGGNVSNIDTTIIEHDGVFYRFTKNEDKSTVIMEYSDDLSGEWKKVAGYTLDDMTGYEGPTAFKINGENKWCLLLDFFSKKAGYKPFVTDDIAAGSFRPSGDFKFDDVYRHGTVMPITAAEYETLTAMYPV